MDNDVIDCPACIWTPFSIDCDLSSDPDFCYVEWIHLLQLQLHQTGSYRIRAVIGRRNVSCILYVFLFLSRQLPQIISFYFLTFRHVLRARHAIPCTWLMSKGEVRGVSDEVSSFTAKHVLVKHIFCWYMSLNCPTHMKC